MAMLGETPLLQNLAKQIWEGGRGAARRVAGLGLDVSTRYAAATRSRHPPDSIPVLLDHPD